MFKLYAQAAVHKPQQAVGLLPKLPCLNLNKTLNINPKHCQQYNNLTFWRPDLAAVIHPNYVQTLSLPMQLEMMVADDFPFKPIGLVHLANHIEVNSLPERNATLQLETSFGELYFHNKGWVIELLTKAYVDEKVATIGRSYYLSRTKHGSIDTRQTRSLPNWIAGGLDEHIQAQHANEEQQLIFKEDIGRKYARISGDYNPIHLYPYTAKFLGFKKAIAHGMYTKAWVLSLLSNQFLQMQGDCEIKVLFKQPVSLPLDTYLKQMSKSRLGATHLNFNLHSKHRNKERVHLLGEITF